MALKYYKDYDETNTGLSWLDPVVSPVEQKHLLVSAVVGIAARNPYVSVASGLVHGGYHLLSKYLDSGSSSKTYQQNGGPETKSTYKPSGRSPSPGARSVSSAHGGRRSGSKPRKRCPTGFRWNGRRCVKR